MADPFSLFPSSSFHHHIMWRRGKAGGRKQSSHVEQPGGQSSEMTITNRAARWHAMCCWMLIQSTRSTTLARLLPPRRPLHLLLITAFPFPLSHDATHRNEEGECITVQQSQSACHGSNGRCCGGCGEREQQEKRDGEREREEKRKHNISRTHT